MKNNQDSMKNNQNSSQNQENQSQSTNQSTSQENITFSVPNPQIYLSKAQNRIKSTKFFQKNLKITSNFCIFTSIFYNKCSNGCIKRKNQAR